MNDREEAEVATEEFSSPTRRDFLPTAIGMQSGIVVLAVLLGWLSGQRFWTEMQFDFASVAYGVLLSLPLAFIAIGTSELGWTWGPFGTLERDFKRVVQLFQRCTVGDLFVVSLLAGVGEEALFRGVMQTYAAEFVGTFWAVIVTAVIFGALHAISATYAIGVMIVGVYLGALYVWFGNLTVPVVVHGAYDFIALVYAVKLRGRLLK